MQTARLLQFITWVSFAVFGFAVLEIAAFVMVQDLATAVTGAALFGYGIVLTIARSLVIKHKLTLAVHLTCFGHLIATLLVIPVRPDLAPALVVSPFLPVGVALPYTSDRVLRLLLVSAWFVAVIAAIYGSTSAPSSEP